MKKLITIFMAASLIAMSFIMVILAYPVSANNETKDIAIINNKQESHQYSPQSKMTSSSLNEASIKTDKVLMDTGDIEINSSNFPDKNFRTYISKNIDTDQNGTLSTEELLKVTYININSNNPWLFKSLDGIEYFTNLETLNCSGSYITALDLKKNTALRILWCSSMPYLRTLNISSNTSLESLNLNNNKLIESLDLSPNIKLKTLKCNSMTNLANINLSMNTDLKDLDCSGTVLTSLDLSYCANLGNLNCSNIKTLENLDLKNNKKIIILNCSDMDKLVSLNLSNALGLTKLTCTNLKLLTDIDISKSKSLQQLDFSDSNLSQLDVSENTNLTQLKVNNTALSSLNVTNNEKLTRLECNNTNIDQLDVRKNLDLEYLYCSKTNISDLDLSKNEKLSELNLNETKITNIDLSSQKELRRLYLNDSSIKELDLSKNLNLFSLQINNTSIDTLDLKSNINLSSLEANNTLLSTLDVGKQEKLSSIELSGTNVVGLDIRHLTASPSPISTLTLRIYNGKLAWLNVGDLPSLGVFYMNENSEIDLEVPQDSFLITDMFPGIDISKVSITDNTTSYDSTTGRVSHYTNGSVITYDYNCGTKVVHSNREDIILHVKLNITVKQNSTISIVDTLDKIYDGVAVKAEPHVVTTGSTGEVTYLWEMKNNDGLWETCISVPTNAGTYRVTATIAGDNLYLEGTSVPMEFTISKASNAWEEPLTMNGWTYSENMQQPNAVTKYGEITYTYSQSPDGNFSTNLPTTAGIWYVKAVVADTNNYTGLEDVRSFIIKQKDLSSADIAISDIETEADLDHLVIKDGDKTLVLGTDYIITKNNVDNKTIIEIIGKGNYTGSIIKIQVDESDKPSTDDNNSSQEPNDNNQSIDSNTNHKNDGSNETTGVIQTSDNTSFIEIVAVMILSGWIYVIVKKVINKENR